MRPFGGRSRQKRQYSGRSRSSSERRTVGSRQEPARIHPLVQQVDGLALAGAVYAAKEDDDRRSRDSRAGRAAPRAGLRAAPAPAPCSPRSKLRPNSAASNMRSASCSQSPGCIQCRLLDFFDGAAPRHGCQEIEQPIVVDHRLALPVKRRQPRPHGLGRVVGPLIEVLALTLAEWGNSETGSLSRWKGA